MEQIMTFKNQNNLSLSLKNHLLKRKEQKINLKNNKENQFRKNKIGKSKLLPEKIENY